MKAIRLSILAAVLLIAGVWSVFEKFSGNVSLNLGLPLSSCSLEISGSAKGGWLVAALLLLLGAAVVFAWALITAVSGQMRVPPGDVPSANPTDQKLTP